ncbi:MAG TPA: hypothetical protein PKI33_14325 [Anaerolineales bacterium]|nr:hypothetical protein [Anaerolineales bacterium]HNM38242.1 hypothetical protein [Anaerolineales bacterium]
MKKYIGLFLFCVFIVSCVPVSEKLSQQDCKYLLANIKDENINTDFRIIDVSNEKIYEDLYNLIVNVDNFSLSLLTLSPNKDLKVFFLQDSIWVQQVNSIEFPLEISQIGVKSPDDPGGKTYSFMYNPANLEGTEKICVTMIAIKDPQGLSEPIGSYFEFSLEK